MVPLVYTIENPPEFPEHCTVAEIRRWMSICGRSLAEEVPVLDEEIVTGVRKLLDLAWGGDEPRPSAHEVVALLTMTRDVVPPPLREVTLYDLLFLMSMLGAFRNLEWVN